MRKKFVKMEGLGNSFLVTDEPLDTHSSKKVSQLCQKGGVDGLLVATPVTDNIVQMKYWNADGSVAEMCGNGLRCVAKFSVDNGLVLAGKFTVKTDVGDLQAIWGGGDPSSIEVQVGRAESGGNLTIDGLQFQKYSVGNPHAVTFVNNIHQAPVHSLGPVVENNANFPNRTNVEFVELVSPKNIKLRVWERGVGETKACGTGMVAAAAAVVDSEQAEYPVEVEVVGGSAKVWIDDDGFSRMIGPARIVENG